LGDAQRAILSALEKSDYLAMGTTDLAAAIHRSPRQVRAAVAALARRGSVIVTKNEQVGWKGAGSYGPLVTWRPTPDTPVAVSVPAGQALPGRYSVDRDTDYYRAGMPTAGAYVWLPDNRARYLASKWEAHRHLRTRFPQPSDDADYADLCRMCTAAGIPSPER
jgi:hypothetical protein